METANQLWLEDLSVRLLCVLALDRFGDYVSDEVFVCVVTIKHILTVQLTDILDMNTILAQTLSF